HLRRDLQEADRVIGERVRVRLPHRHRMRHQLSHRRLEVVVADGPARDAGRARADVALVEDQDVRTPTEPAGPQFPAEMPGSGEPVDACADDHVPAVRGDHGPAFQIPGTRKPSISMPKSWPTDTSASNKYRPDERSQCSR